jgi:DNA polymerase
VQAEQTAIDLEIAEITGGAITGVSQVAKITALLRDRGHKVTGITKKGVKALLALQPADDIRRILTLRQEGGRAAARKLNSLIAGADADQRLRGCFRFHGAATGRWSGSRFQPQNLKKSSLADLGAAVDATRSGELERVREIGPPLAVVGDLSRALICAKPGKDLVGADYSAIESRVLAWLANETWKLDVYRKFDSTGDPADEPYCVTASRILARTVTPDDKVGRQIGKVADLALGYGGGLGAWRRFATSDMRSDEDIQKNIADWRRTHPAIVGLWKSLERTAHRCLRSGLPSRSGNVGFEMRGTALLMVLPSGRRIAYPEAKLVAGKFDGTFQILAKDNAKGTWRDGKVWFGTLIENLVQGVARDLLAAAMLRLEDAGYPIVLHCHDEAVAEVPRDFGHVQDFLGIMLALPEWAGGLPIAAKPWRRECYAEPANVVETTEVAGPAISKSVVAASRPTPAPAPAPAGKTLPTALENTIPLPELIEGIDATGKVLCPFHADTTPSLHVYDHHFHCYACGAHGDDVDWLMMVDGLNREQAQAILAGRTAAVVASRPPKPARDPDQTLLGAHAIWNAAKSISGTSAIRYLADVRAIDVDALPQDDAALRYHPQCPFGIGRLEPCLVALYRDVLTGEPAGLHRIALTPGVFAGAKVERMTLGRWPRPRAIKLWPANGELFLGEGIETVLAAATVLGKRPAWAAGSAANISKFPVLRGTQLTLLVDFDDAGVAAANTCRERYRRHGRDVRCLRPKQPGFDFNDIVRAIRAEAVT